MERTAQSPAANTRQRDWLRLFSRAFALCIVVLFVISVLGRIFDVNPSLFGDSGTYVAAEMLGYLSVLVSGLGVILVAIGRIGAGKRRGYCAGVIVGVVAVTAATVATLQVIGPSIPYCEEGVSGTHPLDAWDCRVRDKPLQQ